MIYEFDDIYPSYGNWKYKGKTIREVLQKDSGYVKDLIMKSDDPSLSDSCMKEAVMITKGHHETWVKQDNLRLIFDEFKPYTVPYGYDFNDDEMHKKNQIYNKS